MEQDTILPKHHKLKRRVELKERKILEILKNHFRQFYKVNDDNNNNYGLKNMFKLMYCFVSKLHSCIVFM